MSHSSDWRSLRLTPSGLSHRIKKRTYRDSSTKNAANLYSSLPFASLIFFKPLNRFDISAVVRKLLYDVFCYLRGGASMRKSVMAAVFAALVPLALASVPAEAVPMLVTSRAALGGNDFIDWADLGPSATFVSNPFTITSQNGLIVDVSHAGFGDFQRREQGMNINGDFAPGDALLFTLRDGAPISLEFDDLVFGGGAQIQRDAFGAF